MCRGEVDAPSACIANVSIAMDEPGSVAYLLLPADTPGIRNATPADLFTAAATAGAGLPAPAVEAGRVAVPEADMPVYVAVTGLQDAT